MKSAPSNPRENSARCNCRPGYVHSPFKREECFRRWRAGFALTVLILLALWVVQPALNGQTFPPIGFDTGPAIRLTINPNGTISVVRDLTQGPYDNIEDTYLSVVNASSNTVDSIQLGSTNPIFGFDGDGICGID